MRIQRLATAGIIVAWLVCSVQTGAGEPNSDSPSPVAANQTTSLDSDTAKSETAETTSAEGPSVANFGQIVLPPPKSALADPVTAAPSKNDSNSQTLELPVQGSRRRSIERGHSDDVPWYRNGLMSLFAVLVAIGLLAYLARRFVPSVRTMNGGAIEVLGRSHLAAKQTLVLVRIGRRVLLLGATGDRIATLCDVHDPDEVAELLVATSRGRQSGSSAKFTGMLRDSASGFEDANDPAVEFMHGPSEGLHRTKGRLQSLLGRLKSMQESE